MRYSFQSTPSGRKATWASASRKSSIVFQSTPSGRKATSWSACRGRACCFNPRLPGGRRHRIPSGCGWKASCFNPRLPGGRRPPRASAVCAASMFQSTPSGRKATGSVKTRWAHPSGFNPRLPGGRRPRVRSQVVSLTTVSIHAFREEGDFRPAQAEDARKVSIHAFREEGDLRHVMRAARPEGFNPRLPGGRRPLLLLRWSLFQCFNPRLPGGRRLVAGRNKPG